MARISRVATAFRSSINAIESAYDTRVHSVGSRLAVATDEGIPGVRCSFTIYRSPLSNSTSQRSLSLEEDRSVHHTWFLLNASCHERSVISDSVSGFIA